MSLSHRSAYYASVLLRLHINSHQSQILQSILCRVNESIAQRFVDLKRGFFNDLEIPFNPSSDTPLISHDLPYDSLIRGLGEETIKGRPINPRLLNFGHNISWPTKFFNDELDPIGSYCPPHISLTPIVNYTSPDSLVSYKQSFEKELPNWKDSLTQPVQFNPTFNIFTRYDYNRFFLVLTLSTKVSKIIEPIMSSCCQLRLKSAIVRDGTPDIGTVIGESPTAPVMSQTSLHVTLGVFNFPLKSINRGNRFGMYELYYLNEVLLKPKDYLIKKYQSKALNSISDPWLQMSETERNELQMHIDRYILSLSGSELRYNI